MLNIFFGDMPEAIYNTSVYFDNTYQDKWITNDLTKKMIESVDKSKVIDASTIQSPVLGLISPKQISGGVKTLILVSKDKGHIFNASTCGDNCASWFLEIARERKVVINLRHIMDFGDEPFRIRIMNDGKVVKNMQELVMLACEYV